MNRFELHKLFIFIAIIRKYNLFVIIYNPLSLPPCPQATRDHVLYRERYKSYVRQHHSTYTIHSLCELHKIAAQYHSYG